MRFVPLGRVTSGGQILKSSSYFYVLEKAVIFKSYETHEKGLFWGHLKWASKGEIFRCLCSKEKDLISGISRLNTRFEVYFHALVFLLNLIMRACHELEQRVI